MRVRGTRSLQPPPGQARQLRLDLPDHAGRDLTMPGYGRLVLLAGAPPDRVLAAFPFDVTAGPT